MIVIGIILSLLGMLLGIGLLWTVGVVLVIVGLVLMLWAVPVIRWVPGLTTGERAIVDRTTYHLERIMLLASGIVIGGGFLTLLLIIVVVVLILR